MSIDYCTPEESEQRLEVCMKCENFVVTETGTECTGCACSISLMITTTVFKCPKDNW